VNRDHFKAFEGMITPMAVKINNLRQELSEKLDLCQDAELVNEIREAILEAESNGTNTIEVYTTLIKKLS